MAPHLTSAAYTCLSLVNYERNLIIECNLSQFLIEIGSCHLILERGNGFDNNSTNILSLISSWLDGLSNFFKGSIFFSSVFMLEFSHRILNLREWSSGPIVCWNSLNVYSIITAWKCSNWISMISIFKSKDAKVWSILDLMLISILQESNSQCRLVGLSCGSIIKVYLRHARWSNWHNDFSQKISVIVSWKDWCINSMSDEAVI